MNTSGRHQQGHKFDPAARLREVEELIDLAEEISARIETLEQSIVSSRGQYLAVFSATYLTILGGALLYIKANIEMSTIGLTVSVFGLTVVIMFGLGYTISRIRIRNQAKRDLEVEVRLIGELLEMITGLLASIESEVSVVRHTVLTMRLRRIKFSADRIS